MLKVLKGAKKAECVFIFSPEGPLLMLIFDDVLMMHDPEPTDVFIHKTNKCFGMEILCCDMILLVFGNKLPWQIQTPWWAALPIMDGNIIWSVWFISHSFKAISFFRLVSNVWWYQSFYFAFIFKKLVHKSQVTPPLIHRACAQSRCSYRSISISDHWSWQFFHGQPVSDDSSPDCLCHYPWVEFTWQGVTRLFIVV